MFDNFELLLGTGTFDNPNLFKNKNIENNKKNKKNKIKFSTIVLVKLIPFYYELNNFPTLWWTPYELMDFKVQASKEIMQLKQKHPYMCISDAQKLLYQPNNISYDENNFSNYF